MNAVQTSAHAQLELIPANDRRGTHETAAMVLGMLRLAGDVEQVRAWCSGVPDSIVRAAERQWRSERATKAKSS